MQDPDEPRRFRHQQHKPWLRVSAVVRPDKSAIDKILALDVLPMTVFVDIQPDQIEVVSMEAPSSKPDSVEKLLARIEESGAREDILTALLGTGLPSPNTTASLKGTPQTQDQAPDSRLHQARENVSTLSLPLRGPSREDSEDVENLVSPLHIVTSAISSNTSARCDRLRSQIPMQPGARETIMAPIKERLAIYFDDQDASLYFQLFFKLRNPLIGLLDATLHTREYVYANSFTLFSVICALGCALSARPRDRAIYPVLTSLANGNVKWSIAAAVKSLATIQAIMGMQYWAPMSPRQSDDTYWLTLSHALQLAREMEINKSDAIRGYVNTECEGTSSEFRERCVRNYERTWLRTLIADKGFGIMNGRLQSVSWREVPRSAANWWKSPLAEPSDRMISGVIEVRGLLLRALDKRRLLGSTSASILEWHKETCDALTQVRKERCIPDDLPSAKFLPILAFYMDHNILVLNAQAFTDLTLANDRMAPIALLTVERKSIEVASRALELIATDKTLAELAVGLQNNQFIMICHAITEILRAIKRGCLSAEENSAATEKVMVVIPFLDGLVQYLPASSAAHLYFDLARFFACQIDSLMGAPDPEAMRETIDAGMFTDDWFKSVDSGMPDITTFLDMGYLGLDQSMVDFNEFLGTEYFEGVS
ncbi:hypothetical protein FHETE_7059 [Fusarium heterosporum]|uniref:Transcription factor domain-containing protein n=1 Tax=Fusarium heterosporum TaxID=42747 RepID=A0A8H5T7H2_FUSHE|nr:hypothetical protein FHETE_7059 [Fusarium heterosporum]